MIFSKNRGKGSGFLKIGIKNHAKSRANTRKRSCNPLHKHKELKKNSQQITIYNRYHLECAAQEPIEVEGVCQVAALSVGEHFHVVDAASAQ